MKKTVLHILGLFLIVPMLVGGSGLVFPACAQTAATAQPSKPTPEAWLMSKGKAFLDALSQKGTKVRYVRTKTVAEEVFNQGELARLALGKYWREFKPDEQERYKNLFIDYFVVTYASTALPLQSLEFKVTEKRPSGQDILLKVMVDTSSIMKTPELQDKVTPISDKEKMQMELIFALRERQFGHYYIRDVQIEGQSLLLTARKQVEDDYIRVNYVPASLLERMENNVLSKFARADQLEKLGK